MGQHDNTLANSHGDAVQNYYVCSPSAPAFIPQSPMSTAPPPSHFPYLYHETYPQMSQMLPGGTPVYSSDFLKPPPMSHYVLNVDGAKIPVEATEEVAQKEAPKKYPWYNVLTLFTIWLSVGEIAIFIVSVVKGGIVPLSENFNIGPPTSTLVDLGAKEAYLMRYEGQGWRFITAMFLHAGILHILLNLIAQVRLGISLEREWGRIKFLIVYMVAGVGGTLFSCLAQPDTISVGASGAILGLVGAYFANIILIWKSLDKRSKKIQVIQACFILLVLGLMCLAPHIDSSAHFGGLILGFLLGFAMLPDETHTALARKMRFLFWIPIIVYFAVGFWYFYARLSPPLLSY